jgi:hypothetical protein
MADRYEIGQHLQLKKRHPCGQDQWEVIRLGADVKLRCTGCGRMVFLEREELLKRTKKVIITGDKGTNE